jgi:hypothetical protein
MNRDDFKRHTASRIEDSIRNAENALGVVLPRETVFQWISPKGEKVSGDIAEEVVRRVFVDENNIYPCVDLGPSDLETDGRLLIGAIRAGYAPRPFGKNWTGADGPFVLIYGEALRKKIAEQRGRADRHDRNA